MEEKMKKIIIFSIIMVLVSFQAFCAGSSEGVSSKDSRGKTIIKEEIKENEEDYKDVFIVSQITDQDLTLEILSYKESLNFFPEGVNFENKNQNNPLIKASSLKPKREDYLNSFLIRIKEEGGVIRIDKSSEKTKITKNILYIFSNKESFMIVSLENSIIIEVNQEEILAIISEWYDN
jgi:hypothetical protein